MKNKTLFSHTIISLCLFSTNLFCYSDVHAKDTDVVAVVNGQELGRDDLANILIDVYGSEGLDMLIRRTLVRQLAQKQNVNVTDEEVKERIEYLIDGHIKRQMKGRGIKDEKDLERELDKSGLTMEKYRNSVVKMFKLTNDQIKSELLAEKIIKKTIKISDEELHRAYEDKFGEKIIASQIVSRTLREAEKILERIKSGSDFEALAKKESIDRASASHGGKMRPFEPHGVLGKSVADINTGEISEIIKTDSGYHILRIDKRIPRSTEKFSEVKDDLVQFVTAQKIQNRIGPWLTNLIETSDITKKLTD